MFHQHHAPGRAGIRAFTLIELLIVVAIIAVLALIAIPNFLEAQTRAKVARSVADMATLGAALEAYAVDCNNYVVPDQSNFQPETYLIPLTTPVAYITSLPEFPWEGWPTYPPPNWQMVMVEYYRYENKKYWDISYETWSKILGPPNTLSWSVYDAEEKYYWYLSATGPDGKINPQTPGVPGSATLRYDPTNGVMSAGDLIRVGP